MIFTCHRKCSHLSTLTTTLNSFLLVFNQYQRHYIHHQQQLHHLISFYYCASPISKTFYSSSTTTTTTPFNFYYCASPISTICSQQVFILQFPICISQACININDNIQCVYESLPRVCLHGRQQCFCLLFVQASSMCDDAVFVCLDLFKN